MDVSKIEEVLKSLHLYKEINGQLVIENQKLKEELHEKSIEIVRLNRDIQAAHEQLARSKEYLTEILVQLQSFHFSSPQQRYNNRVRNRDSEPRRLTLIGEAEDEEMQASSFVLETPPAMPLTSYEGTELPDKPSKASSLIEADENSFNSEVSVIAETPPPPPDRQIYFRHIRMNNRPSTDNIYPRVVLHRMTNINETVEVMDFVVIKEEPPEVERGTSRKRKAAVLRRSMGRPKRFRPAPGHFKEPSQRK